MLGLVAVTLTAAAVVPVLGPIALAADLLVIVAAWFDASRAARAPLEASRSWPPLVIQGESARVSVEVTSRGSRDLHLRLRDGLHPGVAAAPERTRARLKAGARAHWEFEVTPRRRGAHRLAPLSVRILGPWGLAWAQRDLLEGEVCRVFPQVRWGGRAGRLLSLAHRRELGRVRTRYRGEGGEPYALREYSPGDPLRVVHWKATARHGRPISREEVLEAGARLIILLDCGRSMATAAGGRSKLDHALAASLALARVASSRGDRVHLAAFADRVLRTVRVGGGSRGIVRAYERLYDLEARLVEPAWDLAREAVAALEPRRSTVVLLTSVADVGAAEVLRDTALALGRRHRTLLVNLEDPELRRIALASPVTAEQAFAKSAALSILLDNRALARHLRERGVRVVATAADQLAADTLDAYLALCRGRGR